MTFGVVFWTFLWRENNHNYTLFNIKLDITVTIAPETLLYTSLDFVRVGQPRKRTAFSTHHQFILLRLSLLCKKVLVFGWYAKKPSFCSHKHSLTRFCVYFMLKSGQAFTHWQRARFFFARQLKLYHNMLTLRVFYASISCAFWNLTFRR